ncbi:MAG TPA: TolC family protein [Longimicrobiales bacterium]|nr:TolC family protein [Longimicrobiales bacterium]
MRTKKAQASLLVALTLGLHAPLAGQELAALLAAADSTNPQIAGGRRTAEAAAARVPQAGALPDPMIGVGLMNVPVTRPGLGNDMMTMLQLRLGAELPWPGKLGLSEDVARLRAEAATWEVERVRQGIRAAVESAYYQIYFVDRALEVTGRNEGLVGDFARLTSSKYGVGTAAQPDVLRAQVERTSLSDQLVALREQRVSAVARLNALLARPTNTPVSTVELPEAVRVAALSEEPGGARFASAALADVLPGASPGGGIPSVAELQRLAIEHSPMIQAHVRHVEAQGQALALAEKAKLPDVSVTAGYSRRAGFGDFFDVMVSASVPIFAGRKQDQGVFEQAALLAEHEARHAAMVDELNAEIASLAAELARARDQLVLLNDGILPLARTGLASATASYQVGRVDFLMLLDSQVTLYRHELDYHRLLADFATNLAALERAVGTEVLP